MNHLIHVLLAVILLAPSGFAERQIQVGERKIFWNEGVRLASLLRPDDGIVVVEKTTSHVPPFHVGPDLSAVDHIQELDATSDAIFVVRVKDITPQLTATEDWITTKVRVDNLDRVKRPKSSLLGDNGLMTFEMDGGEMRFGKTIVRAGNYPLLHTGTVYLVTLVADRNNVWHLSQHFPVSQTGRISNPEFFDKRSQSGPDRLVGMQLADVTKRLKKR